MKSKQIGSTGLRQDKSICLGCEAVIPPDWRICQECRGQGLRTLATAISPSYTPTPAGYVYLFANELQVLEELYCQDLLGQIAR